MNDYLEEYINIVENSINNFKHFAEISSYFYKETKEGIDIVLRLRKEIINERIPEKIAEFDKLTLEEDVKEVLEKYSYLDKHNVKNEEIINCLTQKEIEKNNEMVEDVKSVFYKDINELDNQVNLEAESGLVL